MKISKKWPPECTNYIQFFTINKKLCLPYIIKVKVCTCLLLNNSLRTEHIWIKLGGYDYSLRSELAHRLGTFFSIKLVWVGLRSV